MSSEADTAHAGLEDEFAVAIATARGGADAGDMARAVLDHDRCPRILLGLTDGAQQAAYYDGVTWSVQFIPLNRDGLSTDRRLQVTKLPHRSQAETWVRDHAAGFAWLHPRVRWITRNAD